MKKAFTYLRAIIAMVLVLVTVLLLPAQVAAESMPNLSIADILTDDIGNISVTATPDEATAEPEAHIISEIEEKREQDAKHFLMSDGSFMVAQYETPVHFENEKGEWEDYDNSMKETAAEEVAAELSSPDEIDEKELTNTKSDIDIRFSKSAKTNNMIKVFDGDYKISWGYSNANKSKVQLIKNTEKLTGDDVFLVKKNTVSEALYQDIYKDVDLQAIVNPQGVKENIILKSKNAQNEFTLEYKIQGLTVVQDGEKAVVLKNSKNDIVYRIEAPYMTDAKAETSTQLKLELVESKKNKFTLKLTASKEWLQDSEREYPVKVDPYFLYGQDGSLITAWVSAETPSTPRTTGSPRTYVGNGGTGNANHYTRTYMKLTKYPTLNKGDMIIGASVNLFFDNTNDHRINFEQTVSLHEVKSSWDTSITWNSQNTSNFFDSTVIDYQIFNPSLSEEGHWFEWDITSLMKKHYTGQTFNGLVLKAYDEQGDKNTIECMHFIHDRYSNTIGRPVMAITYRNNKGLEDYWSYTSFSAGTAGTAYVNDYSGNLVFVQNDASINGSGNPFTLQHIYNNYLAGSLFEAKTGMPVGRGWKLNIHQTIRTSGQFGLTGEAAAMYPYVWTDGDGTDRYIYKKGSKYLVEDGSGLELIINTSAPASERFTIKDDKGQKLIFSAGSPLEKMIDKNGNVVRILYENGYLVGVKTYMDGQESTSSRTISFTREANSNYIKTITDPAGRVSTVNYPLGGGRLGEYVRPDGTKVKYEYDSDGSITKITDIDGYSVRFTYSSLATGKQVTSIQEYATNGTAGQKITFDRSKYNTTIIKTSGVDGIFGNTDDVTSTYQFDNSGRTISVKNNTGNRDMGAAVYTYTASAADSSASNIKTLNRVSSEYATGSNAVNLLTNHSFEKTGGWANAAWNGTNTFTGGNSTEQKYFGTSSYKLSCTSYTDGSRARAYQNIMGLTPGSTYTISGYIKVASLSSSSSLYGAGLAVSSFNASENTTGTDVHSEYIKEVTDTAIDNGWRRVSLQYTVPANTVKTRVNLFLRSATGIAYFDGIQVEQYNNVNPYNMLENPSMETHSSNNIPTGWGGNALTVNSGNDYYSTGAKHGAYSFRMKGDTSSTKQLYQTVPVSGTENDTYIVSGWAKANAVPENEAKNRRFKISVEVVFTDGTVVSKQAAEFNRTVSDWQFTSSTFNLSDGTSANKTPKEIKIYLRYFRQANYCYFDNIQLLKDNSQSYTYDDDGKLISVVDNSKKKSSMEYTNSDLTKYVDAKGYDYKYTYDSAHNMTKATSQRGTTYNYTYDAAGNATALETKTPAGDAALKSTVSYTSDKLFPAAVTDQHGNAVTYEYNKAKGLMTSVSDNTGTVAYEYNSSNDLLTTVTKGSISNSYDYTAGTSRNLTTIARNNTYYNMTYDVFNNNIANKVGTQMLSQNTYGANNGLLQQLTYGTGQRVNYSYDAFGNISQISYNGTAAFKYFSDRSGAVNKQQDLVNNLETRFEYDTTGRLVRRYVVDTSKAVNTNRGLYSSEYGYDLNNNVTKFVNSTPGGTVVNSYTYGKDNFLEKHTLPSGKAVTYSYDNLGRTTKSALNTTTPLEHTYTYLLSDRNTEADNGKYRTTQIRWESIGDDWYRYTYDQQGNITVIEKRGADGNPVIQHEYTYDTMNQLIREWDHVSMQRKTYAYNAGGNLTTAGTYWYNNFNHGVTRQEITTYGYTDTNWNDKLTTYKGQEITYDAIGNPLNYRDGMVMTWKNGRQLATLQTGGNAISYSYDSGGTRVSKTVNGVKHTYQYVNGKLHFEQRGDATVKYSYNSGGGLVSAIYKPAGTTTETTYYYGYNWRGDVVALYNADGSKFCDYEYDAWGKVVSVKRASGADVTSATHFANFNPFRYRSYYYDTDSGLYYLMSRYYDPTTCRFVNADGYFQSGGALMDTNMNAYCANNPVNYLDSTGKCYEYMSLPGGVMGNKWIMKSSVPGVPDLCGRCNTYRPGSTMEQIVAGTDRRSLPKTGTPNSKDTLPKPDGTPKQDRWYDENGNAERDRDYNHSGDMPFPHDHVWKDGKRGKEHLEPSPEYNFTPFAIALGVLIFVGSFGTSGIGSTTNSFLIAPDVGNQIPWDKAL